MRGINVYEKTNQLRSPEQLYMYRHQRTRHGQLSDFCFYCIEVIAIVHQHNGSNYKKGCIHFFVFTGYQNICDKQFIYIVFIAKAVSASCPSKK